jgi:DNA topoisomerase I
MRLRRVDCTTPGIERRRAGRGFSYVDENGARITDPATLDRIRALAVPPAWRDVWICPLANGHIQAVGIDSKGRRQYRYHDQWRVLRDREKFDHMVAFAEALPGLRDHCVAVLRRPGDLTPEVVAATAIRLLDLGAFRVGGEGYLQENGSHGLATLEKSQVRVRGDLVSFDFVGKGGRRCLQDVNDRVVARVVRQLRSRRGGGRRLLASKQPSTQRWVDLTSDDINAEIRAVTGGDFTAKEFRTWNATVLAAVALAGSAGATTRTGRQRAIRAAVGAVAEYLGDTPAVTRKSYIDPRLIDRYLGGDALPPEFADLAAPVAAGDLAARGDVEPAVLDVLRERRIARAA